MVLLGEAHDIVRHFLGVVLDHVLLIEQRGRAVAHRMEKIAARPVEDRHEVVADDLHAEGLQVADGLDIILDVPIPGGKPDLDVVVNIDALDHVGVEARRPDLIHDGFDLLRLPDLPGHLVVQGPDDGAHTRNLPDVAQPDSVVSFAVPAKTHLHRHVFFLLLVYDYIASAAGAFRMMAAKGACFYYGKSGVGFFFTSCPAGRKS